MNEILEAALTTEQILGREVVRNSQIAYIRYEEFRILQPRSLVIVDDKEDLYVQFFVKSFYYEGMRSLFSRNPDAQIEEGSSTASIKLHGDYQELVIHIDKFPKYLTFIERFGKTQVI